MLKFVLALAMICLSSFGFAEQSHKLIKEPTGINGIYLGGWMQEGSLLPCGPEVTRRNFRELKNKCFRNYGPRYLIGGDFFDFESEAEVIKGANGNIAAIRIIFSNNYYRQILQMLVREYGEPQPLEEEKTYAEDRGDFKIIQTKWVGNKNSILYVKSFMGSKKSVLIFHQNELSE